MNEHTLGPWTADFSSEAIRVRAPDGSGICTINWLSARGRRSGNEGEANARLIAAAPTMLMALNVIASSQGYYSGQIRAFKETAEAAIKAAVEGNHG